MRAGCGGGEQLPGVPVEAIPLGEVRVVRDPALAVVVLVVVGLVVLRRHRALCRVSGRCWRVRLGLGKRERSRSGMLLGAIQLFALVGYEVADPQQTRPHAVMEAVLAGDIRPLPPGRGPGTLLVLFLPCLQELDHTLQDLCLLHFWIFQFLKRRELRTKHILKNNNIKLKQKGIACRQTYTSLWVLSSIRRRSVSRLWLIRSRLRFSIMGFGTLGLRKVKKHTQLKP